MKKSLFLLIIMAVGYMVPAWSQNKTVKKGSMQVTVPESYNVSYNDDGMMKGIMVYNDLSGKIYMFMELAQLSTPEYLMQYAVKNIDFVASATFSQDGVKTRFNSYDACMSTFTTSIGSTRYNGKAYTLNDGKNNSFGIIALYKTLPASDPILASFKLVESDTPQRTFKNAREEMQFLIDGLSNGWGTSIGNGMLLDKMELHPTRDELIYTMRFASISIADIEESKLPEVKTEIEASMPGMLKVYAANMPAIKRCMDENYTFVYRVLDKDKRLMVICTCTPQQYK